MPMNAELPRDNLRKHSLLYSLQSQRDADEF
jgi:hypothetical protein